MKRLFQLVAFCMFTCLLGACSDEEFGPVNHTDCEFKEYQRLGDDEFYFASPGQEVKPCLLEIGHISHNEAYIDVASKEYEIKECGDSTIYEYKGLLTITRKNKSEITIKFSKIARSTANYYVVKFEVGDPVDVAFAPFRYTDGKWQFLLEDRYKEVSSL